MSEDHNILCRQVKTVKDCIHGYIPLTYFAINIIDTKYFQRLRDLNQLGTCKYVFPNAVHTRFEHSIGTYYLAGEILKTLVSETDPKSIYKYLENIPELKRYYNATYEGLVHPMDLYVCELIKIAALCHDLGHGPFSHVFDDIFLPSIGKDDCYCSTHEERSGVLLELIIKQNDILSSLIHDDEIRFIKTLINPSKKHIGFMYQLVSNTMTGLDVDKYDYLQRDIHSLDFSAKVDTSRLIKHVKIIDNNLVYPEQAVHDIYNLFHTRHLLHVQVYCHKVTISTQFAVVEIFSLLDDILGISESIEDMDKFCEQTDSYILNSIKMIEKFKHHLTDEQLIRFNKAKVILHNLETRNLYSVVYHFVTKDKMDFKSIISEFPDKDDILVFQNRVGFVSGDKPNPLDSIYVYKTKDSTKIACELKTYRKKKEKITILMPSVYQECIITIYYKNKHNTKRITELYEYFDNMFGEKL